MKNSIQQAFLYAGLASLSSCAPHVAVPPITTTLADADPHQVDANLRAQIKNARLELPKHFDLFPTAYERDPVTITGEDEFVVGEDAGLRHMQATRANINNLYYTPSTCVSLTIEREGAAIRSFVALHEFSHLVSFRLKTKYGDLNHLIYHELGYPPPVINVPPSVATPPIVTVHARLSGSIVHPGNQGRIASLDADYIKGSMMYLPTGIFRSVIGNEGVTYAQIEERVADTDMTLFALSNFKAPGETLRFISEFMDWRNALYSDVDHNTNSSVQAATIAFAEHPRRGLNIIQTALWTADIIMAQKDLRKGSNDFEERFRLPDDRQVTALPSPRERGGILQYFAAHVLAARNRICVISPSGPP